MDQIQTDILNLLRKADHPLIVPDVRVDGDSIGSAAAIIDYLALVGKSAKAYISGPLPERYQFIPHADKMTTDPGVLVDPTIDLLIFVDCSDGPYVAEILGKMKASPSIINIDHHATNPRYGTVNLVDTGAPATAELVYQLLVAANYSFTREAVTALLTGITFDTTALGNGGTNARALNAVADLTMMGGKPEAVANKLLRNRRVQALRVWGTALGRLRKYPEHNLVVTHLTRADLTENGVTDDEMYELKNYLGIVSETDTVCVLKEQEGSNGSKAAEGAKGSVGASFRSVKRDVAALAKQFGGGGHKQAAGCEIPGTLQEAEATLLAALQKPMP